jgi:hypothetical protein
MAFAIPDPGSNTGASARRRRVPVGRPEVLPSAPRRGWVCGRGGDPSNRIKGAA